jgi:hypothetical protein
MPRTVFRGESDVINLWDFGAVGDNIADDTSVIQAALNATGGKTLAVPTGYTFKITAPVTVNTANTVITGGGTIRQATSNVSAFSIRASNVTVDGVNFTGPGNTAAVFGWDRNAIDVVGTSASLLTDLVIRNVSCVGFPGNGILVEWVDRFRVTNFHIESIKYAGVVALQAKNGEISNGRVIGNTIGLPGNENCYGVFLSLRGNAGDTRTENVIVSGCHVSDFPTWEGLNTHGGRKITFANNLVERCKRGVAAIRAPMLDGTRLAPIDCAVVDNTIDSGSTDAVNRFEGIAFSGAVTGVVVNEYATGRVVGNTIRRHGQDEANRQAGGIVAFAARGLTIAANNFIECSTNGIALNGNLEAVTVTGNTIIDPHATVGASAACVRVVAGPTSGVITGNSYVRGTLTGPTHIGDFGIHIPTTATPVRMEASGNDFQTVGIQQVNDLGNTLIARSVTTHLNRIEPPRADQLYAFGVTPGGGTGPLDLVGVAATDVYGTYRWIEVVNPPNERITFSLAANQIIPTGAWTPVSWTAIVFQAELPTTVTTPASGFTIPFGGQWHVDAAANFGAGASGERGIRVKVGASVFDDFILPPIATVNRSTPRLSRDWSFSTGAVVTVEVWQDSGADLALATRSVLCMRRIGLA